MIASLLSVIKHQVESLPEAVGLPLSKIPFSLRLGPAYVRSYRMINALERVDRVVYEKNLLAHLRNLLKSSVEQVIFYRDFYQSKGFSPNDLQSLEDWSHVPIVTKADFQRVSIGERCQIHPRGFKINTGGTSGQPLEFYLDNQSFAREWAHMHFIWKAHGYLPGHLKLTFRGSHFDSSKPLRYNAVHNEYIVNANTPMSSVVEAVMSLPHSSIIRWLHGYPSLVAEFAHTLASFTFADRNLFRNRIFGILLGSEYPAPIYRKVIEDVLSANIVTWYGHSEMAVLARETSRGVYASLPTYGYTEAVRNECGEDYRLVSTSLHNHIHPFIRYDTGDLVEPVSQVGGSLAFRITEGRVGDFVHDRLGRRHSLTAIIFGRHHAAFEFVQHLQVRELCHGIVTLVVSRRRGCNMDKAELLGAFDLDDLDIKWEIEIVNEPIRTKAGKIKLKLD